MAGKLRDFRLIVLLDPCTQRTIVSRSTVISRLELALWHIVGKALDQPVYNLLGGRCRDKVPAYASGWYLGERGPQGYGEKAKKVVAMGYKALKFDPFGSALHTAARR